MWGLLLLSGGAGAAGTAQAGWPESNFSSQGKDVTTWRNVAFFSHLIVTEQRYRDGGDSADTSSVAWSGVSKFPSSHLCFKAHFFGKFSRKYHAPNGSFCAFPCCWHRVRVPSPPGLGDNDAFASLCSTGEEEKTQNRAEAHQLIAS